MRNESGARRLIALWSGASSTVRSFGRSKVFAAAAVLTVALGVGLSSVVFSLFDRLLFRPLPFSEPGRLVQIHCEVFNLEWRQIDWEGRMIHLDPGTTKSGEGRSFPFTTELEDLLRDQWAEHERLRKQDRLVSCIFHRDGQPIRSVYRAWRTACKRAGVPGRRLHDFRRTAVRNFERLGISRSAGMAMVGHRTESIYRRYAITDSAVLHDAAAKIDDGLGTLSGTPQPDQAKNKERSA